MFPFTIFRKIEGNGRNWPGFIIMDPDAPLPAAVWAQEYYEAQMKLNPWNLLRVATSKSARRKMELMGHEIETQVAVRIYRKNEDHYRSKEADALLGYSEFKGVPKWKIILGMIANKSEANKFINKNMDKIRKYAKKT
jgi:hypothetical protein